VLDERTGEAGNLIAEVTVVMGQTVSVTGLS